MAKVDWGVNDAVASRDEDWGKDDRPAAKRDLPKDVQPSTAGAGRGSVNPPTTAEADRARRITEMDAATDPTSPDYDIRSVGSGVDAKRTRAPGRVTDADIPRLTPGSAARDVAAGVLQIGPTAVKGVGDVLRLASGDTVGKGVTEFAERGSQAIRDVVGSERGAAQRRRFEQDMQDPALNAADVVAGNPGALADQVLPTAGSMALPIGAAAAADKLARAGRAAQLAGVIDPATVAARAATAADAAVTGTIVAQNAGDTYGSVRDAGGDQGQAYLAAAITAPATYLASRLTGGGAEGVVAKGVTGQPSRTAATIPATALRTGARESVQEMGEQAGQYVGETVGTGQALNANTAGKQVAVAGVLGFAVGGGAGALTQRAQKLREAGEEEAARLLERRATLASVDAEIGAMGDAAAHPSFQQTYREQRLSGMKPAEAAARTGIWTGFTELASGAGLSEKAVAAARERASKMPLDEVPAFLERYVQALTAKGVGNALPPGSVEQVLGTVRDDAIGAALDGIYADTPKDTADAITALEQAAAPAAPAAEPAAETFDSGNDVLVTPEADSVHQAATSPLNDLPEPTQAQKDAGNYKVGRLRIAGLDISVENPQGSVRRGTDADGEAWESPMRSAHYGYIRQTEAKDGDKLDVFVKPGTPDDFAGPVFVVDQIDPKTGKLDEHKVVLGASDQAEAESIYRSAYDANWQGLGAITQLPLPAFKAWAQSGKLKEPLGDISQARPQAAAEAAAAAGDLPAVRADEQPAAVAGGGDGQAGADAAADAQPALTEPAAPGVSSSTSTPVQRAAEPESVAINSGEKPNSGSTPESATSGTDRPQFTRNESGTLTVRGDPVALIKLLADNGITRVMRAKTGVLVGKTEADKAERFLSKRRKAPKAAPKPQAGKPLSVGMTPSSAEPVTVKDGVVYVGKSEALDFDSGEPIKVPAGATDAQIKKALQDGGAISRRQHFYGGEEGAKSGAEAGLTAPTKGDVLEQQRRREEGEKAEAKAKQEREAKAKADAERDEFRLSGSDRAADANPDQGAMFAREDQPLSEVEKILDKDTPPTEEDIAAIMRILEARRGGLSVQKAQEIVDSLTKKWKNGPKVNVVASARDLPVRAPSNVRGIYRPGEVWVVASSHRDGDDVRRMVGRTLAHEAVAHYGLRDMLDSDGWSRLMRQINAAIAAGNKPLAEIKAEVRRLYVDDKGKFNLRPEIEADEIAARVVETAVNENGEFRPGFGFVKAVYAKIAEFLRSLGIEVTFTNAELHGMLVLAQRNLEVGKRTAGGGEVLVAAAREPGQSALAEPEDGAEFARAQPDLFAPDTWSAPEPSRLDSLIYELQDGRVDVKRVQQAIQKAGQQIEERFDARLAETLYPGRVARRTESFLDREVKPLLLAMAREQVGMDELADYLIARHAPERNEQVAKVNPDLPDGGAGRNSAGTLMTNDAAAAYLEAIPDARRAQLAVLAAQVDAITAGTRGLLVTEGLEKSDTVQAWEAAYSNYVPLFKDEAVQAPHPTGMGFTVKGPASKRATGSTKQVTNVLAHVMMQREAAITRAEKNRVGLALYGLALSHPNPQFWTTIRPGMSNEQIGRELQAMGVDPAIAAEGMQSVPTVRTVDPVLGRVVDRPNPIYKSLPGAITLKVNGEDRVLMLNTKDERGLRMAEALKNMDGMTQFDLAGSIVGRATHWIAAINTQYNPAFGFVNLTRDTLSGSINLGNTPLRGNSLKVLALAPLAMQGIARELAGGGQASEWSRLWKQFQDDGGRTGYRELFREADERAKAIERELQRAESAGKLTPAKAARAVLGLLDGFNMTLENSVRLAAYKVGLDAGLSRAESARIGRELTVDFNRKGRLGRELGPLYAFFNASVQGGARTIAALAGPTGARIIAGGFTIGVLQALMLMAAGYDEDEIPEFVKTRALIIPLPRKDGEKRFISIPYPLGLHVLPNTGRVVTELSLNGGKDIGKRTFNAVGEIASAFNPLGGGNIFTAHGALTTIAPTLVDPVIDLAANKNFAGNTISKEARSQSDNRPGYQRAKESTLRSTSGQAYLGISKAVNSLTGGTQYEAGIASPTPETVRYIAQVAGGGLLREVEKSVDSSVKALRGEKVKMSGIPLAGRFYGEVDADQVDRARYFGAVDRIAKFQSSFKAAEKAGDAAEMRRLIKEHRELVALMSDKDAVQRQLSDLNQLAVTVVNNPQQAKQIDEARLQLMRGLTTTLRRIEEQDGKPTIAQKIKGITSGSEVAAGQ